MKQKNRILGWDLFFIFSFLGIWPRFIEPNLLTLKRIYVPIKRLHDSLHGLKILQMSDLHFGSHVKDRFLKKIESRINKEKPQLILLTGDFICQSHLGDATRLSSFLSSLATSHKCFAVLGNHDYEKYVSVNEKGDYDVVHHQASPLLRGFKRFFCPVKPSGKITQQASRLMPHTELLALLQQCNITLLHNQLHVCEINDQTINLVGLGEYMLGKAQIDHAFASCDPKLPTIVMVHNPDAIPKLTAYPGDLIVSGHTHGGHINIPGIWQNICPMEHPRFKKGWLKEGDKWVNISRGLGGTTPFRLFASPEMTLFTLGKA
ncbi:MAG: metallophosphoesterase [Parachlamydiaceae bacterium]